MKKYWRAGLPALLIALGLRGGVIRALTVPEKALKGVSGRFREKLEDEGIFVNEAESIRVWRAAEAVIHEVVLGNKFEMEE
jgi:hypothetical protein